MSDLIDKLRARRLAVGMTQAEVGAAMGLANPQQRIGEWERGARPLTVDRAEQWARILDCEVTIKSAIALDTPCEGE